MRAALAAALIRTPRRAGYGAVRSLSFLRWLGLSQDRRDEPLRNEQGEPALQGWTDEYSWMEQGGDRFYRHLRSEDRNTTEYLKRTGILSLAAVLESEQRTRSRASQQLAASRPLPPGERIGPWEYFSPIADNAASDGGTGAEATLLERAPVTDLGSRGADTAVAAVGAREIVLDAARLSAAVTEAETLTGAHLVSAVVALKLSPCHQFLTVTVPQVVQGYTSDVCAALILRCDTGTLIQGGVVLHVHGVEWFHSSDALLVSHPDKLGRPHKVGLYKLPNLASQQPPQASVAPIALYTCEDPAVHIHLGRTKDGRYILMTENTKTSSQVHLVDAHWNTTHHEPPHLICVHPRVPSLEYYIEHWRGNLLILTNARTDKANSADSQGQASQQCKSSSQTAGARRVLAETDEMNSTNSKGCESQGLSVVQQVEGSGQAAGSQCVVTESQGNHSSSHAAGSERVLMERGIEWEWLHPSDRQAPVQRTASVDPCTDECTLTYVPIAGSHTSAFSVDSWRALPGLQLPRGTSITDMDVFDGWVALYGRYNALPAVWVAHLSTGEHTDTAYSHHTQGLQHRTAQRSTDVGVEQEGQGRPNTYNDTNSVNVQVVKCDRVDLPAWVTDITPGINADPSRRALRVIVSSPAHPPRTCEYDVNTGTLTTLHAEVAAGRPPRRAAWAATRAALGERGWGVHDPDAYGIARLWVPVKGPGLATRAPTELPQHMPVTIAGARDVLEGLSRDSTALKPPVLLLAYGAYGVPTHLAWDPLLLTLMERGVLVAWAHVRGGGDVGRSWAAAGRGTHKHNSVSDYRTALHALVDAGVAAPGGVAAYATSAGAVLVSGALVDPSTRTLLACAVMHVGFLDVTSCMAREDLPLTAHERDEWGDARDATTARAMQETCPYASMRALHERMQPMRQHEGPLSATASHDAIGGAMPAVLATTAEHDARVPVWAPVKWLARARKVQQSLMSNDHSVSYPLLLRVLWGRGHHASADEEQQDKALAHAFMLHWWRQRLQEDDSGVKP